MTISFSAPSRAMAAIPSPFVRRSGAISKLYFVEDQYRPTSWLTLNGGLRLTHFGEPTISENHADPRIGAAIEFLGSTGSCADFMVGTTSPRRC